MEVIRPAALIEKASNWIKNRFLAHRNSLVFHSIDHTLEVYENTSFLAQKEGLQEQETLWAKLAALFHDVGYLNTYHNHEESSVSEFLRFCHEFQLSPNKFEEVPAAIMATKIPQDPGNKASRVVCDADLFYLGTDTYFTQSEKLRKEWSLNGFKDMSAVEFHTNSLNFFDQHSYHTQYGNSVLDPMKEANKKQIIKLLAQLRSDDS